MQEYLDTTIQQISKYLYISEYIAFIDYQGTYMLIKEIRKTEHYKEFHENQVPWDEVVRAILSTKHRRKKGDRLQIETNSLYILCKRQGTILWVINAKRNKK